MQSKRSERQAGPGVRKPQRRGRPAIPRHKRSKEENSYCVNNFEEYDEPQNAHYPKLFASQQGHFESNRVRSCIAHGCSNENQAHYRSDLRAAVRHLPNDYGQVCRPRPTVENDSPLAIANCCSPLIMGNSLGSAVYCAALTDEKESGRELYSTREVGKALRMSQFRPT